MAVSPTACLHCSARGCSVTAQEFCAPPCSAPPDSSVISLSPVRCCGLSPGLDRLHVCLAPDQRINRARYPPCSSASAPNKPSLDPCVQWDDYCEQHLQLCWDSPCSDLVHMDSLACDGSQCSHIPENLPAPFKNASCIEANFFVMAPDRRTPGLQQATNGFCLTINLDALFRDGKGLRLSMGCLLFCLLGLLGHAGEPTRWQQGSSFPTVDASHA